MPQPPTPQGATEIVWPVWVGGVPERATAFQHRDAEEQLRQDGEPAGLSQVIIGDGGVGKSQLAAHLTRQMRDAKDRLDVLLWATGSPDQIITAYAEAAERLHLPTATSGDVADAAQAFLSWLAATEQRWLVVLDDITEPAAVDPWWPDGNQRNGRVLATSRRDHALLSGKGRRPVRLGLYTAEEARNFLHRRLTDAGHLHLHEQDRVDELAAELGHLPLALGHAAAYMINKRCTTTGYLTRFRDTNSRLDDLLPPDADTEGYGHPVTTALLISLEAVDEADTTRLARPLLQLIPLMDPAGHPPALWATPPVLEHLRTTLTPTRRRWPARRTRKPAVAAAHVDDALACLRAYGLITQDVDGGPIRVHALTARAIRETIPPDNRVTHARAAADALMEIWPEHHHLDRDLAASLRTNTIHLEQHSHPALFQPDAHPAIYKVSNSLKDAGPYNQALAYNQATVRHTTTLLGTDHNDTLTARGNLAASYSAVGRTAEAIELEERVLTDRERILGPDHPNTLTARGNLALSYGEAGRTAEAIELEERVLTDRERILGPDHPDTLLTRGNLALSYQEAGRTAEATDLGERVLTDSEEILGPDHPNTLTARGNLATIRAEGNTAGSADESK
ncbi:tetratricopeptide repeat protein [Streptomyces xiamenensis]|uniref:tetratricopeptide repeat protein n=1 Tax=Streptomyces xiamenensis TaxID=408015 RepID=UPI0035DA2311